MGVLRVVLSKGKWNKKFSVSNRNVSGHIMAQH